MMSPKNGYDSRIKQQSDSLKRGETVCDVTLPLDVQAFFNAVFPYGENRKMDVYETAGKNWNITKSPRIERKVGIREGKTQPYPCRFQHILVDGKYHAFIYNRDTTFLNDRNSYVLFANIGVLSEDDPWGKGCEMVEKAVNDAIGGDHVVDDYDSGPTMSFYTEEDLLGAIDALVASFGDDALVRIK